MKLHEIGKIGKGGSIMKRLLAFGIAAALLLGGCGAPKTQQAPTQTQQQTDTATTDTTANQDGLQVVTSFYPIYILTLNITDGVEGVSVTNMTQPQTGCLHDYELTSEDMKTLEGADVFLINGLGMESFLPDVQKQYPTLFIGDTSKGAYVLEAEDDHMQDDVPNAHIWLDPQNAIRQTEVIRDTLSQKDPAHATQYAANADAFVQSLSGVLEQTQTLRQRPESNIALFHEGFDYLAEICNLDTSAEVYAEENQEPSAREMAEAAEDIREDRVQILLCAEDNGKKYADTLAAETGARVIVLDPLTSGEATKDAYRLGMEENLRILSEALGQ